MNENEWMPVADDPEDHKEKIAAILALLAGILGIAAAGGTVPRMELPTEALLNAAAVAVPGLLAWLVTWLIYNQETAPEPEA